MPIRERPYVNGNFRVKIEGDSGEDVRAGFEEVILPEIATDVIAYRNGNEKRNRPRKITGGYSVGNVVLKRGLIGSDDLWSWFEQVRDGMQADALRDVTIELRDETGENVAVSWHFRNARPVKYRFSNLQGDGDEILLEIVELACEDVDLDFG